ncbi:MAG TPA: hypothetical protein VN515_05185 [Terriglobales bacterium]|nr:hypothetical protein [Terriglobales bacterium]
MRNFRTVTLIGALLIFGTLPVVAAGQFPQLLPDPDAFVLTIRENPGSKLPLGPSCGGDAAVTLACRSFIVTLKNVGGRTVHLSRPNCREPNVGFSKKQANSSTGWWPISQPSYSTLCDPLTFQDLRLRPGDETQYETRLVSPNRLPVTAPTDAGEYTIRATWSLYGCTEESEGTDCLAPPRIPTSNSAAPDVDLQSPIQVVSNQIEVSSPSLPDLGPLRIGFEVSLATETEAAAERKRAGGSCASPSDTSAACTVFHYAIHNLSSRPIRNGRWTCSDFSIIPEHRAKGGAWAPLSSRLMECSRNFVVETPIMPGQKAEGDFSIASLAPLYDAAPLDAPGTHELRFRFQSEACWAAPDGSFCLQRPKSQTPVLSRVITLKPNH